MAKYEVTRACGHTETVNLLGKIRDREYRLEHIEPNKLCYECWQKELAEQREKENAEAAEVAKEMNLPQLTGSEKQMAWAETIRQRMLYDIDVFVQQQIRKEHRNDPKLMEAIEHIRNKSEAKWWIDRRFLEGFEIRFLLDDVAKEAKEERMAPPPDPEVVEDAKTEATVRPENPKTETVAEIRALESRIEIHFPEKREDFRELVKFTLDMQWNRGKWKRKIGKWNGTPADRAAEAGHRLLAAGFIIRTYDDELRARAINGDYEPENTRWVRKLTEGEHEGWFVIVWDRRKDDFYRAARRIKGSKYNCPNIVVPPEQFEEVLDFAQMYDFQLSEGAQEALEAARQMKDDVLVANVEAPPERERIVTTGKPPKLDMPEGVGIADEFKD